MSNGSNLLLLAELFLPGEPVVFRRISVRPTSFLIMYYVNETANAVSYQAIKLFADDTNLFIVSKDSLTRLLMMLLSWSDFFLLSGSFAAAFCTRCNGAIVHAGKHARTELQ